MLIYRALHSATCLDAEVFRIPAGGVYWPKRASLNGLAGHHFAASVNAAQPFLSEGFAKLAYGCHGVIRGLMKGYIISTSMADPARALSNQSLEGPLRHQVLKPTVPKAPHLGLSGAFGRTFSSLPSTAQTHPSLALDDDYVDNDDAAADADDAGDGGDDHAAAAADDDDDGGGCLERNGERAKMHPLGA